MASLKVGDAAALVGALDNLSDKEVWNVAAGWMAASTEWQTARPGDLKGLADALGKGGEKSARERLHLAEHLAGKFLASPEGTRSATCGEWRGLAGALRKDLSPGMCKAWMTGLRDAYAEPKALAGMKTGELNDLTAVLESLGDKDPYGVVVAWTAANPDWGSLGQGDLQALAEAMDRGGNATKTAKQKLSEYVVKDRLATPDMARGMTIGQWRSLAAPLGKDLDPVSRQIWIDKIRGAFADPQVMAAMKAEDVRNLAGTLEALGDKKASSLLAAWVLSRKAVGPTKTP
jgi:hypothetical protein